MLARALVIRLFGTRRLALESGLVLGSLLLLLGLAPYILQCVVRYLLGGAYLIGSMGFIGLFAGILPGLLIVLVGVPVLLCLVVLFLRGCLHVAIRYLNWALTKYYVAREDVRLNAFYARPE